MRKSDNNIISKISTTRSGVECKSLCAKKPKFCLISETPLVFSRIFQHTSMNEI